MKIPVISRLFGHKPEIRADTAEGLESSVKILELFDTSATLTKREALEIPTVSACIGKITEAVSRLPVKLYRKQDGRITEVTNDPRIPLLNGETGDTLSTVDMWRSALEDYYVGSGAWIYINSDGIRIKSLHYVDCSRVSFIQNHDPIFKAFHVLVNGQRYYDFQFLHFMRKTRDGYSNIPIQRENPTILSAAYNALKLENTVSLNGGSKRGFIKSKNKLTREAIDRILDSYETMYSNEDSKRRVAVLNDGVDFQEISATSAELQLNENKKTNSIEICKLFGFPHTIIDGGATPEDKKEFISAVVDVLNHIETALDTYLLLETEKEQGYYWAFDTKELTRGSILERYQAYAIARQHGILQTDEIRREEDYEPLGFNFIQLGLADVLLDPETMEIYTPNTGRLDSLKKIPPSGDEGKSES